MREEFTETVTMTVFLWLTAMFAAYAVAGTVIVLILAGWSGLLAINIAFVACAVVTYSFARVRVSVSADGIRIRTATGIPIKRIDAATIETVTVARIRPWSYGGYGIRAGGGLSARRGGRYTYFALLAKEGPGLLLGLRGGGRAVITLPGAERAAAILAPRPQDA